jgi:hypothetical protein
MSLLASISYEYVNSWSSEKDIYVEYVIWCFCMFHLPFCFFKACSAEKVLVKCAPEETEMSINAKFRAIQPTPSMLSYVEDNVRTIVSYQPSHML